MDDAYVAFDIRGDNKLIWLEWDDMRGLYEQKTILHKIKAFKERNMKVIDGLKSKLVREGLFPDGGLHKPKKKTEKQKTTEEKDSDAGECSFV